MARPDKIEAWHIEVAELIARTGVTLREAVSQLGIQLNSQEADALMRRKSFNRLLWESRHRFFIELAKNPNWKKDTAIGKLMFLGQKLEDGGEFDKASEVIFKAAKMAGWVGPESTVSVFGELSQADLDAIRKKVEEGAIGVRERVN